MTITTPSEVKPITPKSIKIVSNSIDNRYNGKGFLYMYGLAAIDRISVISEIQNKETPDNTSPNFGREAICRKLNLQNGRKIKI